MEKRSDRLIYGGIWGGLYACAIGFQNFPYRTPPTIDHFECSILSLLTFIFIGMGVAEYLYIIRK